MPLVDLSLVEQRYLRALVGIGKPLEVRDNGLGYNNLLYISVLLAALAKAEDVRLHLILVEEPEAVTPACAHAV